MEAFLTGRALVDDHPPGGKMGLYRAFSISGDVRVVYFETPDYFLFINVRTLFVTKFKTPMSKRALQYTITKYLQEVGITNASTHTLRHTMPTHYVARETDLKTVQETLGHERLETTAIYVSLAKTAQRRALQEHAL